VVVVAVVFIRRGVLVALAVLEQFVSSGLDQLVHFHQLALVILN